LDISQTSISLLHNLKRIQNVVPAVFYNELPEYFVKEQSFATFSSRELFNYSGYAIATCLYTAKQLIQCPGPIKKFFYIWDFEWTTKQYNYLDIEPIYLHDDITLIARSKYHKDIIDNCWKQSIIIEDFNHEQLTKLFR